MNKLNQRGSAHLIAIAAIILFGVVGFAGYRVATSDNLAGKSATSQSANEVAAPASIKSKADIDQANKALDSDQASNELDSAQLDADINSLL